MNSKVVSNFIDWLLSIVIYVLSFVIISVICDGLVVLIGWISPENTLNAIAIFGFIKIAIGIIIAIIALNKSMEAHEVNLTYHNKAEEK